MALPAAVVVAKTAYDIFKAWSDRGAKKDELEGDIQSAFANGQLAINMQEAKHKAIFVAGWRPFIGWICGFGFAYLVSYPITYPIVQATTGIELLTLEPDSFRNVLYGMLGFGAFRSVEKIKGKTK